MWAVFRPPLLRLTLLGIALGAIPLLGGWGVTAWLIAWSDQALGAADPGAKAGTPSLVLRWKAHDKNLGPRPVTLSYAEKPTGPWLPIAANVENCGHYDWELPAALPPSLFVKVQAADPSGPNNVGNYFLGIDISRVITPVPVLTSGTASSTSTSPAFTRSPMSALRPAI